MPPEHREHGQHHVDMNSRFAHRFPIGLWILDAAPTANSGSGRKGFVHSLHAPLPENAPSLPIRAPSIMILAAIDPQGSVAQGISSGASETSRSDNGNVQSQSMARGRDHGFQGFD